jgi:uncharacterized protein
MKFLLVFAVLLVAFFVWRSSRGTVKPPPARRGKQGATKVIEMGSCDFCGVHCATTDLVVGRQGRYCTSQHRQQAEP